MNVIRKIWLYSLTTAISCAEVIYLPLERRLLKPAWGYEGLRTIPNMVFRHGGNFSYGRWCHIAGTFRALIFGLVGSRADMTAVDVGCGTGGLFAAIDPFVRDGGKYIGIDVDAKEIAICRKQYPFHYCSFIHHPVRNAMYAPEGSADLMPWPIDSESTDLVTALSVWTHLTERDAKFYFREVARVLKPGGHAIITGCVLDDAYENAWQKRFWPLHILDTPLYGSSEWRTAGIAALPEHVVGITEKGVGEMAAGTGMELVAKYPGYWKKKGPELYIQDILVFKKA